MKRILTTVTRDTQLWEAYEPCAARTRACQRSLNSGSVRFPCEWSLIECCCRNDYPFHMPTTVIGSEFINPKGLALLAAVLMNFTPALGPAANHYI
jgi:hypothetical protein